MINFYSRLMCPPDFFKVSKKHPGLKCEEVLMKTLLSHHLKSTDISRGDSNLHEPDFRIGGEWIEMRYAEEQAQKPMNTVGEYSAQKVLSDFSIEVEHAILEKSKKHYSVQEKSVCVFSLLDVQPYYASVFPDEMQSYVEHARNNFFSSLHGKFIESGIFTNIYIVVIGYNRQFVVFDLLQFEKGEDFIHTIGVDETAIIPYREMVEVTTE